MAENLGRCDKKQYEHCGPHPQYTDVGQRLPPFGCVNWKPEPEGVAENDAPERIWIDPDDSSFWDKDNDGDGGGIVEYVRAGLAPDATPSDVDKLLHRIAAQDCARLAGGMSDCTEELPFTDWCVVCQARGLLQKYTKTFPAPDAMLSDDVDQHGRRIPFDAIRQAQRETWNSDALKDWDIVGMNHYHVDGERRLFVAMTNGIHCIRAEGADELQVFRVLELNAAALRAEGEKGK